MDTSQTINDAENALRDFIAEVLSKQFGAAWVERCGVTEERLSKWREKKLTEEKKQRHSGIVDERLLYYADFYDLSTILKEQWNGPFAEAFGDQKAFLVLLAELEKLRNPGAHGRELLPHQKNLALGLSGEVRTRIARYRSERGSADDVFPRIEAVRDNFGNVVEGGAGMRQTKSILRPGMEIVLVVTAFDPEGLALEYAFRTQGSPFLISEIWQKENTFSYRVTEKNIGRSFGIRIEIRSPRPYHAHGTWDDNVEVLWAVLPGK